MDETAPFVPLLRTLVEVFEAIDAELGMLELLALNWLDKGGTSASNRMETEFEADNLATLIFPD